jgi:23S rRNA (cytosine1962-C5)-methyltransferase
VKVTTVDMSNTYLQWAEKNMHLNGFKSSKKYDYIREDILDWIPTVSPSSYDLIILDPPTFSNSKKMLLTWDVQRDHVALINQIRSILTPGGILYFSNNYKKFKFNLEDIEGYESIEELTDKSIPEDFERSKPHVCFRLINK